MRDFTLLIMITVLSGCATRKDTMLYTALASGVVTSLAMTSMAPEGEEKANMVVGALGGALFGTWYGDALYEERVPESKMQEYDPTNGFKSNVRKENEPLSLKHLQMIPDYTPRLKKSESKKYMQVKGEYSKELGRPYSQEHILERQEFEKNGKKWIFPEVKIIELGKDE